MLTTVHSIPTNHSDFMLCIHFTYSAAWLIAMVLKLYQPLLARTNGESAMMKMVRVRERKLKCTVELFS